MAPEFLGPISNAPKARNAGIPFQPPIRHDPVAIKLHDETPGALAKGPDSGRTTTRREQQHASA